MTNLSLRHICYTRLNAKTWCATAQFISLNSAKIESKFYGPLKPILPLADSTEICKMVWQAYEPEHSLSTPTIAHNKRQQQRSNVRLLLKSLLTQLNITDTLDDSQFPYQLTDNKYYVCFSHSANKVAVSISSSHPVGIDIETQDIAWGVAQRYYHSAELTLLTKLSIDQRIVISKWLWQLKESFIKIYQYKLAQGLGINYAAVIPELIASLNKINLRNNDLEKVVLPPNNSAQIIISDKETDYEIAILDNQQTIIVF